MKKSLIIMCALIISTLSYAQEPKSLGSLEFNEEGILFAGDNTAGAIFAFDFTAVVHHVLTFSLTGSATVFWEFGEFFMDKIIPAKAPRVLDDTLLDMALGIVGGMITLSIICIHDYQKNVETEETRMK